MIDQAQTAGFENVSRETFADFLIWHNMLNHWNKRINLVGRGEENNFWLRHALDSWQLTELAGGLLSGRGVVLDLGSGAGFPGLAFAIGAKYCQPDLGAVFLVEANGKKCNFLRAVIRKLDLPATVLQKRVENLDKGDFKKVLDKRGLEQGVSLITARAFAPLVKLLDYAEGLRRAGIAGADTKMLFPKGGSWEREAEQARKQFEFELDAIPSRTNPNAKILSVTNLHAKDGGKNDPPL